MAEKTGAAAVVKDRVVLFQDDMLESDGICQPFCRPVGSALNFSRGQDRPLKFPSRSPLAAAPHDAGRAGKLGITTALSGELSKLTPSLAAGVRDLVDRKR